MTRIAFVSCLVAVGTGVGLLGGCVSESKPSSQPKGGHTEHSGHSDADATRAASLVLSTTPERPRAREPVELRMMLHDSSGQMLKEFEQVHEKLAHLIIVREGLDEFAHLHPKVDAAGNITSTHMFPLGGTYHVFLDHKPAGKPPATGQAKLMVEGEAPAAPALIANIPGTIQGDGLSAEVSMRSSSSAATVVTFKVQDESGKKVTDLEPYLGAMGHLVVLSADAGKYVHAHPLTETAAGNEVEFEVHFPGPGTYKTWGQFQRGGKVFTIPVVIQIQAGSQQQ